VEQPPKPFDAAHALAPGHLDWMIARLQVTFVLLPQSTTQVL
jgi:hypothetical protein